MYNQTTQPHIHLVGWHELTIWCTTANRALNTWGDLGNAAGTNQLIVIVCVWEHTHTQKNALKQQQNIDKSSGDHEPKWNAPEQLDGAMNTNKSETDALRGINDSASDVSRSLKSLPYHDTHTAATLIITTFDAFNCATRSLEIPSRVIYTYTFGTPNDRPHCYFRSALIKYGANQVYFGRIICQVYSSLTLKVISYFFITWMRLHLHTRNTISDRSTFHTHTHLFANRWTNQFDTDPSIIQILWACRIRSACRQSTNTNHHHQVSLFTPSSNRKRSHLLSHIYVLDHLIWCGIDAALQICVE